MPTPNDPHAPHGHDDHDATTPTPTAPGRGPAAASWENEGGARRSGPATEIDTPTTPTTPMAPGRGAEGVVRDEAYDQPPRPANSPAQEAAQDVRQDRIMTAGSPDGRPPTHGQRRREWWWLGGGLVLVIIGGVVYAAVTGAQMMTVILAVVLIAALAAAAVPVWGAGLLRGSEQRSAHRKAERGRDESTAGPLP
jgi:hypothetical protein